MWIVLGQGFGMDVLVEIFFLKIISEIVLYKKYTRQIFDNCDPDLCAADLFKEQFGGAKMPPIERCVIHSTSWRYDGEFGIILTYILYSEELDIEVQSDTRTLLFSHLKFPHNLGPGITGDEYAKEENILSHGLRHLGLLIKLNSEDFKGRISRKNLKRLKQKDVIGVAGKLN